MLQIIFGIILGVSKIMFLNDRIEGHIKNIGYYGFLDAVHKFQHQAFI